jgi:hypothetical protein
MYYTRLPMNKAVAWEHALSWGIAALDHQIQRLNEFGISSAYDRARRADLLELENFLVEAIKQWHSGDLEYIVPTKTAGTDK